MSVDRRARIEDLAAQARYASALHPAAAELSALLEIPVTRTDATTRDAVQTALNASSAQNRAHFVWHRVWGVRLRSEFLGTMRHLAELLPDEPVLLVWGRSPAVGFVVPLSAALTRLPQRLGPDPGNQALAAIGFEVLLATGDGASGLRFGYHHHANADQYELLSWGRFARPVED